MSEVHPIAELMARDPLLLSTQDLDAIIADLRKSRSRFVLADDKKIGTPAARKSGAQKEREARSAILDQSTIDDLLGDL
jgi:hypothetical protein